MSIKNHCFSRAAFGTLILLLCSLTRADYAAQSDADNFAMTGDTQTDTVAASPFVIRVQGSGQVSRLPVGMQQMFLTDQALINRRRAES